MKTSLSSSEREPGCAVTDISPLPQSSGRGVGGLCLVFENSLGLRHGFADGIAERQHTVVDDRVELDFLGYLVRTVGQSSHNLRTDVRDLVVFDQTDQTLQQVCRLSDLLGDHFAVDLVHPSDQLIGRMQEWFPVVVALDHLTQRTLSTRRACFVEHGVLVFEVLTHSLELGVVDRLRRQLVVVVGQDFGQEPSERAERFTQQAFDVSYLEFQTRNVREVVTFEALWYPGIQRSDIDIAVLACDIVNEAARFWSQLDGLLQWVSETQQSFEVIEDLRECFFHQTDEVGDDVSFEGDTFTTDLQASDHGSYPGGGCRGHKNKPTVQII